MTASDVSWSMSFTVKGQIGIFDHIATYIVDMTPYCKKLVKVNGQGHREV